MDKKDRSYRCEICNNIYSSYKSLWNHNDKFHDTKQPKNNQKQPLYNQKTTIKQPKNNELNENKNLKCKFCNKIFNHYNNKWRHEKKYKLKEEINKNEIIELKKELELLKNKINNTTINNNNNNNNNIVNNNNNNNNNNIINNITINAIGNESVGQLTDKEIKKIIENNNYMSEIIKYLNFNKRLPQNHVYCITSLEGEYAKYYNHKTKQIEQINKKLLFDKLLVNSFEKLNDVMLYLEISKDIKELINEKKIDTILNKYEENKFKLLTNKTRKKNYDYNINELGYNNKNLIMKTWSKLQKNINNNIIDTESDISVIDSDLDDKSYNVSSGDKSSSDESSSDDDSESDNDSITI